MHYLCRIIHPIFNVLSDNNLCEVDLLKHSNTVPPQCNIQSMPNVDLWVQLAHPNKWLFSLKERSIVDAICGTEINSFKLERTGLIEIKSNCYLRSRNLVIHAHNIQELKFSNHYLPSLNISHSIRDPKETKSTPAKVHVLKFLDGKDLQELGQAIKLQKQSENHKSIKLSPHNIHHYTISYILLAITLLLVTSLAYKRFLCTQKIAVDQQKTEENADASFKLTVHD